MKIIFVLSVLLFLAATIQPHPQCPSFWRGSRRSRRSTQGPLRARPPTQAPVASSCVRDHRNGCSNGGLGGWENTFTSSCDRHDMCYICGGGGHQQWSQGECDSAFLANMKKACSKVSKGNWWSNPRADCNAWAGIYYRAVRMFGSRSYNKAYCEESCIPTHGDPNRMISL